MAGCLAKKLGARFAIYGYGWKGPYAKGKITFLEQMSCYHKSRITVAINNALGAKYYFSNRLPIAMLSGITVVHNYEEGFEELFVSSGHHGVYFFKTTEEALEICDELLSKSQNELDEIGKKAFQFSFHKFTGTEVFKYMIDVLMSHKKAKDLEHAVPLIKNPWISIPKITNNIKLENMRN
jgi:hypothetical protein